MKRKSRYDTESLDDYAEIDRKEETKRRAREKKEKIERRRAEEEEYEQNRKKGHGCRNCFIATLVICLVMDAALIGGAFFAWNRFGEPYTGLTLTQAGELIFGLWKNDEDKIITNPYDAETDLDAFYAAFKQNMFIDASVEVDLVDLAAQLIEKKEVEDENGVATGEVNVYRKVGTDGYDLRYELIGTSEGAQEPSPAPDNGTITGNAVLDDFLNQLEFDFSGLSDYDADKTGPRLLEVTDKQFAALLNDALHTLGGEMLQDQPPYMRALAACIGIGQVVISQDETWGARLDVTVSMRVRDAANAILEDLYAQNSTIASMKGLIGAALKMLPDKLFLTATVFPESETARSRIAINSYDEEKIELLSKLIDRLGGKLLGDKLPTDQSVLGYVNASVRTVIGKVGKYAPIDFVPTGASVAPIKAAMDKLGVEGLSEQAFLSMIRDVKLPTAESLGLDETLDDAPRDAAVDALIVQLCQKYAFDNEIKDASGTVTGAYLTRENLLEKLPALASSDDAIARIHPEKIDFAGEYTAQKAAEMKLDADYVALAGILNGYIASKAAQSGAPETEGQSDLLADLGAKVLQITGNENGDLLQLVIRVGLSGMIRTEKPALNRLIGKLVPDELFIYAEVNVADPSAPAVVRINGKTAADSRAHIETIKALASKFTALPETFDYDRLCAQVSQTVNESLSKMKDNVGVEPIFQSQAVLLPNLFEIVSAMPQFKEEGNEMQAGEIYAVMRHTYTYRFDDANLSDATDAQAFVEEINRKYYLKSVDPTTGAPVLDGTNAQGLLASVGALKDNFAQYFDREAMNGDATPDERYDEEHHPEMREDELGFLLSGQLDLDQMLSFLQSPALVASYVDEHTIFMMVGGAFKVGEQTQKYAGMLPKTLYLGVTVDVAIMRTNADLWRGLSVADDQKKAAYDLLDKTPCASFEVMGVGSGESDFALYTRFMRAVAHQEIDRDKIARDVDRQVVSAMSDFAGADAPMTVDFVQGGVVMTKTVFDLAVDAIYGDAAEGEIVPEPMRLRTVLRKIDDGLGEDHNLVDRLDGTLGQINDKYFLNESAKLSIDPALAETAQAQINRQIKNLSANYATAIDGKAMALSDATADLSPRLPSDELALMIAEKFGIAIEGMKKPEITSLRLTQTYAHAEGDRAADAMVVVFRTQVDRESALGKGKYANLLPAQNLWITVTIDLDRVMLDRFDPSNPDALDACVSFTINDMTDHSAQINESGGDMALFESLIGKLSTAQTPVDFDGINRDASREIRSHLKGIGNGTRLRFSIDEPTHGGAMLMGSVYEMAASQINDGQADVAKQVTPDGLHAALRALFSPLGDVASASDTAYTQEQAIDSSIAYQINVVELKAIGTGANFDASAQISKVDYALQKLYLKASVSGEISDRNLMGTIIKKEGASTENIDVAAKLGLSEEDIDYRWMMLARGNSADETVRGAYTALDQSALFASQTRETGDFLLWTVNVDLTPLFALKDENGNPIKDERGNVVRNNTLVPERMDVSVAMDIASLRTNSAQIATDVMFNNLSQEEKDTIAIVVEKIMPRDEGGASTNLFLDGGLAQKMQEALLNVVLYRQYDTDGNFQGDYTFRTLLATMQTDAAGHLIYEADAVKSNVSGQGAPWNDGTLRPYFGYLKIAIEGIEMSGSIPQLI